MSSDLLKSVSDGPRIQLLDEEVAARSIVVSNISPQTENETVYIHFQRQKNGGGEIDNIFIPKKGAAVITFDSSEVVETVLKHSHTLNGSALKIRRFIPDNPPEIFQRVSARVNFDKLQLSPQQSKEALKILKDETEIECPGVIEKECVLSGTFTQIENAQKLLQGIFLRRSSVPQPSQRRNETFHYDDSTQTQGNSSESWDTEAGGDGVSSLEVQPQFMKLFKRVYKMRLQEIEENHGVEIVWSENESHVQLHPSTRSGSPQNYQKGCDAFIDLYQNCFPNMCREEIELKNADDGVLEAINSVEAENDVVIEKVGNKLMVYAEKNKITSSVQALKETLGLSKSGRKTRRSQNSRNLGTREHNETIQEDGFSALPAPFLKQFLSNEVKFSLYQGDITDERVDAIVNAANEWLSHGGGVAAAIVRKGGRQIEEESRGIMLKRNRRPLDVGDAVHTKGGKLPCRFVIHTVGPRWSEYDRRKSISLLNRACVESLRLAAQLELCSIALPAISSGIFGMPKDICAQVMFKAIEEFSSSTKAEFSTLRDVRIVIIDDETISFFREEFVKRYVSQETSQTNLPHEERPSNIEREVALKTTPEFPPFPSADEPLSKQPKNSREAGDFKTPNKGVVSDVTKGYKPKEVLDSIKETHPSNTDIPNTKEASPHTGIKPPNVETEANGKNKETDLEGAAPVGRSEPSNMNNAARPSPGRGRGFLAANLSGKQHRQPGSNSNGGFQLPEKGETRNVDAGRGRGMTYATTSTSPPGLTVTDEGRRLAQDLGEQVKDNLNTDPVVSTNVNVHTEENGSSNEASKEENRESKHNNRKTDGVKLDGECPRGHSEDQKISRHSQLGKDDASESKLAPNNGMTDPQETEEAKTSETDRGSKLLTSMDKPNQAKSLPETRIQVDQPSSDAKNAETTYPKHLLPPYQSGTSSETKEVVPTASHGSANEQDTLEGKRTAEMSTVHTPAADGAPLFKMHGVHQASVPNCVMCMNLSKTPVFPLQCGHHFCKSCLNWFTKKTKNCPKCVQENLSQGNQPVGYMTWRKDSHDSLSGYEEFGTIVITYNFQDGIQGPDHPNPGEPYCGLFCTSYLPSSPAGQELGNLLRRAFDERLIFTIGKCPATGEENKIVWNGIELKTSRSGGPANYGYPDPSYLDRAKRQLAEKGILTQQHDESNQ